MSSARLTTARLRQLTEELPAHYTAPLPHLGRARVLTGAQLDRLLTTPDTSQQTTARIRRRILQRLGALGLIDTLQRRIGGLRAGSSGHIYTLTSAGHRFLALLNQTRPPGRIRHSQAPGTLFLAHALKISDIYVDLIHATATADFQIATFVTEPYSWWPLGNGTYLRPDSYILLAAPSHRDCWWLEVDQGSESLPRIRAKCRNYADFATYNGAGPDGALPRVLFTAPDQQRATAIADTISTVSVPDPAMIAVTTHTEATKYLITELGST